ncbi:SNF2 family N-terminal domain-containing protein [Epithele typhae]|uniref:SNF2 family N-terminal domain-containing protein n=1 Tax=Epithele typhae TaxID=378194 RepID=UPI002007C977|nr:SNF2 family N-terminal domain-containing protein [Epithele typhae]KAH9921492.1 SNF2 family N-terminal domain-containing protein [Epithele typhae]
MRVTRGRAKATQSASTTPPPSLGVANGASTRSTPDTSAIDEDEVVALPKKTAKGPTASKSKGKKRALETESEGETVPTSRAAKRRAGNRSRTSKSFEEAFSGTQPFEGVLYGVLRTRRSSRKISPTIIPDSEEEDLLLMESDPSESEFEPEDGSDVEQFDTSDEETMVQEALLQSVNAAREEADRRAGVSSTGRPPVNSAAAKRAAAAERRLAKACAHDGNYASTGEDILSLSDDDDSAEEPLSNKGKGKGKPKVKAMTIQDLRNARKEARATRAGGRNAKEERALRKQLGRKLTYAEKATIALQKNHPELKDVWGDLERHVKIVEPKRGEQPADLKVQLLPFQLESLSWFKEQEAGPWSGGMLAVRTGPSMGKTIQMIALLLSDFGSRPNLVVAPTVAIMQWRNEIETHTASKLKALVWHGSSRESSVKELQKYDVVLTSFAVLESCFRKEHSGFKRKGVIVKEKSPLHLINWHRVILDEAHNIKERQTNTAKATFELKAKYRWCLSGTPLQNRVGELYSLVRFLGGDPFSYYFCKMCDCKSLHWVFTDKKTCDDCGHSPMQHTCFWNNEILTPIQKNGMQGPGAAAFKKLRILLDRMMLRRTKIQRADDLGLPPRTVIIKREYFSPEEKELYNSLFTDAKRQFTTYIDSGTILNNYSNIFSLLTRMRQMACHPDLVLKSKNNAGVFATDEDGEGTVCRLCNEFAEDAIQAKCRHIFDRECIKQYLEASVEVTPACPVCHVPLTIDLEAPALELGETETLKVRQGILGRLDLNTWRSSTKIEALVEELSNLRREDATTKSIVFSQFVNFLDLIAYRLQRAGFVVCRLEGTMSPQARDATIKYFMNNVHVTVFLVSLKAGGVALNLTEASRVYLMDSWWNPAVEFQAMDRIHRLGQHRPVKAIKLVVEDSIESRIIQLQEKKAAMVDATLSADDSAMGRLTPEDLGFLFRL